MDTTFVVAPVSAKPVVQILPPSKFLNSNETSAAFLISGINWYLAVVSTTVCNSALSLFSNSLSKPMTDSAIDTEPAESLEPITVALAAGSTTSLTTSDSDSEAESELEPPINLEGPFDNSGTT
ncbi:unnamed protein product [Ambrosiozyma monospora]|uniref:Unnamed protein product n=1 Tax=Ambrosiozyma monospora TaxID=43982 RepID=A0ACB5SZ01_AMBMO|nr:unnamed protein product [Ambrosiozyma monospora]